MFIQSLWRDKVAQNVIKKLVSRKIEARSSLKKLHPIRSIFEIMIYCLKIIKNDKKDKILCLNTSRQFLQKNLQKIKNENKN